MDAIPEFHKLFEPVRIGRMEVRNRIVMSAMATTTGTLDGHVTRRTLDYYEARARGGVGLVITQPACVDYPTGKSSPRMLSIDDDKFIPGLRELARVIKKHGASAGIQVHHHGSEARRAITGEQPVAPSAIVTRPGDEVPRELTIAEIKRLVACFAMAVKRAKKAGFDGVEIHAGHSHLVGLFISGAFNKRQDQYGGTLENRARFLLEIMQATRELVGAEYPVWCRIDGKEVGVANGTTEEEARALARMLEKAGADAISVSINTHDPDVGHYGGYAGPYFCSPGWAVPLAVGIKSVVSIPVMAVGRITPQLGEHLLRDRKADLIVIGRALRADPELPNKAASGRLKEIIPCLACNKCSQVSAFPSWDGAVNGSLCTVNPTVQREQECEIIPTKTKKRVLIVGGGPAGMEAGRVAALRGHDVTLFEKGDALGGQLLLAAVPPYKGDIQTLINYLEAQVKRLGVKIELNREATPALVENINPDVLILATGSMPLIPRIAGIDNQNVVTYEDVLTAKAIAGERVAILGGGEVACEVAGFLAEKGKKVVIVEMGEKLVPGMSVRQGRKTLFDILSAKGVTMLTGLKGEEIMERGLIAVDKSGRRHVIEADTVVIAVGSKPNTRLSAELPADISQVHLAGDCVKPGSIMEAIDDGSRIARLI